MAVNNTYDLVNYYAKLLIYQYSNKPKAYNTILTSATPLVLAQQSVQEVSFSSVPTSRTFQLSYNGNATAAINWNDSISTIQSKLQAVSGLSAVTVTGSFSDDLIVNFVGFTLPAALLIVVNNLLLNGSDPVTITIEETDQTLPLAVQDAFSIDTAVGVQLDILGKYTGVTRTISTPNQTINLTDDDFRTLIKFAIVQNNSGSSLATIESNLNMFFSGKFIVTDYKNMFMSYILEQSIGSPDFFIALVTEKLIPKPMGVGFNVINPPVLNDFFGFSLYENSGVNSIVKPFNTYQSFDNTWLFLQYENVFS